MVVNVPRVPGVPAVAFGDDDLINAVVSVLGDDLISSLGPTTSQWGLFSGGAGAIPAQSVVAFDYKREFSISDYPVEQGAFRSYNKVALPYDVRLRYTAVNLAQRSALISSIDEALVSLALYDAVTPEVIIPNVNVTHMDYHRTAEQGLGLLQIDVWCLWVNVNAGDDDFMNTATPGGQDQQNVGPVQSLAPDNPRPYDAAVAGMGS